MCPSPVTITRTAAPKVEKQNVTSYDARIWYCWPDVMAFGTMAEEARRELESQGTLVQSIHPYGDSAIIVGERAMGAEMMQKAFSLEEDAVCFHPAERNGRPHARR